MENTENWCFAWFDGVAGADRQAISRRSVWTSGSVITVGFLDGDPDLRTKVEAVAQEWLQRAVTTLSFDFHSGLEVPAVRISFKQRGQWSMIGTTCLASTDPAKPTMNLGGIVTAQDIRRKTLHEFGHVLGLIHEHQVPSVPIEWDRDAVIEDLEGVWSREMIETNILTPLAAGEVNAIAFDPTSIMIYPIKKRWTKNGFSSDYNLDLSPRDIEFVSTVYG
jgi:serralysin